MNLSSRLAVAMIALAVFTALAVGLVSYRTVASAALPRALDRFDLQTELIAARLAASVQGLRADVLGFRAAAALGGMMQARRDGGTRPLDDADFDAWRQRLAKRFVAELSAKPLYREFRVIGVADDGRELLRVGRDGPGGTIRIAPDGDLRAVGERGFFRQALALPDGQAYVSPVQLDPDQPPGSPPLPELLAAAPVYAPDGRLFGMVVIDLDLRPVFDQVEASRRSGHVYIVDEHGDYLLHPDPGHEFGAALGRPFRLQDDFPELGEAMVDGHSKPAILTDRRGGRFGVAVAPVQLADGPRLRVIQAVPYGLLLSATRTIRYASVLAGLGAVFAAIVLAIIVARSLTRPLVAITGAVEHFVPGAAIVLPKRLRGELGLLAGAISRMADTVAENTATIRRNAEIFEIIMSGMADMAVLLDETGKAIYANPAARALLRSDATAPADTGFAELKVFQGDGVTPFPLGERPFRRVTRGESILNLPIVYRMPGGKPVEGLLNGRPIRDAAGKPAGAVIIVRDVTEARAAEMQLRQSQKLDSIGQLTGGVAHDFNNILTVILGTAELLADATADRPDLAALVQSIDGAALRGSELTRQLLAFARRQPLHPAQTDVNALVLDTAKLLRPTLGEQIEIEAILAGDAWHALIDPAQLSAAVVNLAVNARDAMPGGGKLTIETRNVTLDEDYARHNSEAVPGPYVMIAVSDTGAGIPAAIRDKIFEPFFTTKEVGKGTGLGLSMVYGFVKQSGGHIKVYSEEGHGTSIKLYLPRGAGQEAADGSAPAALAGGSETILVVEDDDMVRAQAIALLHSLGYRTLAAEDGRAALALVEQGAAFDLLFTDVIMPGGMNGRQLAEAIAVRRPGLKVLYTSGYTENAIIHHGRVDPGVALLNKPYRKAELAQKIRQVLAAPVSPA